jgi:hypothetical protein
VSSELIEKRQLLRIPQALSGYIRPLLQKIDQLMGRIDSTWSSIFFIVLLICLSALCLWWTLTTRVAVINENNHRMDANAVLEHEVHQLAFKWSDAEFENLQSIIAESEKKVFSNYRVLAQWLFEENLQAQKMGLVLSYKFSDITLDQEIVGANIVPIIINLNLVKERNNSGYWTMLNYLQRLNEVPWKHRLVSAKMLSANKTQVSLSMRFDVWMWDPDKIRFKSWSRMVVRWLSLYE